MNFMVGFVLMTSGCKETESFWLFAALLNNRMDKPPKMAGLHGLYSQGFPLLIKLLKIFDVLFQELLPDLHAHFIEENIPDLLWINKWL
jgi:Rab-GTPase-TBC domain